MASKFTQEDWERQVAELGGGEYVCVSQYVNSRTKLQFRHLAPDCASPLFTMAPTYFVQGTRCPACAMKNRRPRQTKFYSRELCQQLLDEKFGPGEYTIGSDYEKMTLKATVTHQCGHIFQTKPAQMVQSTYSTGCPECGRRNRTWTHEQFLTAFRAAEGADQYEVLSEYAGYNEKITLLHKLSGETWETTPNTFLSGRGRFCPGCNPRDSRYHREVRRLLTQRAIRFEEEKSFPDLRSPFSNRPLWYDFWLPDHDLLIEVDGELHSIAYAGSDETLERRRVLDAAKSAWAQTHPRLRLARIDATAGRLDLQLFGILGM